MSMSPNPHALSALKRQVPPHRERSRIGARCILRRSFVGWACESIAKPDLCRENTGRVCAAQKGERFGVAPEWKRAYAEQQHRPSHKAPSGQGDHIDANAAGLHRLPHLKTGSDDQSAADPALAEGPEQGAHVWVTGIACKPRQFAPHGHLVWYCAEAGRWSGRLPQVTLPQLWARDSRTDCRKAMKGR